MISSDVQIPYINYGKSIDGGCCGLFEGPGGSSYGVST